MTTQTTRRPSRSKAIHTADFSGPAILSRLLHADDEALTPEAARSLLSLRFHPRDERQMNRLAAKARQGTLNETEQAAAEQYNLVSHLLALLQAQARQTLQDESHSP